MSERETTTRRRIEPWALWPFVFFVVLIAVHLVFVVRMYRVDSSSVEADAYARSMAYDEDLAALDRFEALGLVLRCEPGANGELSLALEGDAATISDATLAFYRPDSASLDQTLRWDDPSRPLHLALPRTGAWRVTLTATVEGEPIRAAARLHL